MWGIAWRNFLLQSHRYRVLGAALVLGALVFTVLFGVTSSLTTVVRGKAARYFSGDIMVLGFNKQKDWVLRDDALIRKVLETSDLDIESLHRRCLYYDSDAKLIFNGESLMQRRIIGVDFEVERANFSRLEFVEGGVPHGEIPLDSLWISNDTAKRLHLRVGDEVTLQIQTVQGFRNTVPLRLAGIFQDSSFFGFASYLDYRTLNKAVGRPEGAITELGVSLTSDFGIEAKAKKVVLQLGKLVPVMPQVGTIDQAYQWLDRDTSGQTTYSVFTLNGRLKQINDLIQAIYAVNALLATVFLIVVAIGVYNTYQMIAFERTKEIGTMRALGMQRGAVIGLFLSESLLLGLISSVLGLALGTLTLWALGQWSFSGNLLAQMFLDKGRLAWVWPWQNMVAVLGVMWLTTLVGAVRPAWKASRLPPVEALRVE